ncbi:MAG: DNRLRE domain-containing protein, partial [Acidaminococcaceae bacterium]|nr:DNRLRE domain-containing protein [Acidaminococcaceae bacterium]
MCTSIRKRLLALVLVVSLFCQILPQQPVYAVESSEETVSETETLIAVDALAEEPSLRKKDTKTFRMSDGSFTSVAYDTDIHWQNSSGLWQEIDNTLQLTEDPHTKENIYTTAFNGFAASFAKNLSGGFIYAYADEKHEIRMGFAGEKAENYPDVSGELTEQEAEADFATKLEKMYTVRKASSGLVYKEVYQGADLAYELYGSTLKERIIVHEKQEEYQYRFLLQLSGLKARLEKDGSISLYDPSLLPEGVQEGTEEFEAALEEATLYVIPKPFMKDSSGIGVSQNVRYTLGELQEDGSMEFTVTADPEWMNSEERVFPVTIDPTIKKKEYVNSFDTFVSEGHPTTVYDAADTLMAGWASYDNYSRMRIYWKYNPLPSVPAASIVTNCQILLRQFSGGYSCYPGSETMNLSVREVTGSWDLDAGLYWNNQPSFLSEILDFK